MKKSRKAIVAVVAVVVLGAIVFAISHAAKNGRDAEPSQGGAPSEPPLNISIMLDLSDRILKQGPDDHMEQWEKDTTLIGYIRDWFIDRQFAHHFQSGDRLHVFCYPTPDLPNILQLQDSLTVDLSLGQGSKLTAVSRNKDQLLAMPSVWHRSLESVYLAALPVARQVGSDVWGFFDQRAKMQCVKPGYRNILVIFTDGYLYSANSWQGKGMAFAGISETRTLSQTAILPVLDSLDGLEVLFCEINPKASGHFQHMRTLLTEWCHGMGIRHVDVLETAMPGDNKRGLLDFFN